MKTPDKIYIPFYPNYDGIDTHLSDEWFEGKAIDHVEGWTEYIRKDALIELIEEQLAILDKQTLLHPDDDVFQGQRNAYKQMKDKLFGKSGLNE